VTAILLGVNVVRRVKGIGVNGLSLGLGLVALFVWLTRIAPDQAPAGRLLHPHRRWSTGQATADAAA
jgi:hypothetical protein